MDNSGQKRGTLDADPPSADAPDDLRERALNLAAHVLEMSPQVKAGTGARMAAQILDSGRAWTKFLAICEAQGGFREPQVAPLTRTIVSQHTGECVAVDNRRIAQVAKLAGAPLSRAEFRVGDQISSEGTLHTIEEVEDRDGLMHYQRSLIHISEPTRPY